jgi:hypothetical protein
MNDLHLNLRNIIFLLYTFEMKFTKFIAMADDAR